MSNKVSKKNQSLPWKNIFSILYNASKITLSMQNQNNLFFRSRVNKLCLIQLYC